MNIIKKPLLRGSLITLLILSCGAEIFGASCWNLVWSDEFNGTSINTANWGYDTGCNAYGNSEWENYTNSSANSYVTGGNLVINAVQTGSGQCGFTSARLTSYNKVHYTYGRIEARIKAPYGQGIWPAFWMLGENINTSPWPACGELDIMEMIGGGSGKDNVNYGTAHWLNGSATQAGGTTSVPWPAKLGDAFHVYAIEWNATTITWYFDGTAYYTLDTTAASMSAFQGKDFYIILNVAVGGTWPGYPDGTTVFPQQMLVDYVRWYQQGTCPATPTFTLTCTRTYTLTATPTSTSTRTGTRTPSASATVSCTPTFTCTGTPSLTATKTAVNTSTFTSTFTNTRTNTPLNTNTPTFTKTATPAFTLTNTQAITYTFTATTTFTGTASPTSTLTGTRSPTATASSSYTPINTTTKTPVNTSTPSITFSVTSSVVATSTSSVVPTSTSSVVVGATFTMTDTNTVVNTLTDTPQTTATNTQVNTATFTHTRTATPSVSPQNTQTRTPVNTAVNTPVNTSTRTNTAIITPTNTSQDTATNTPVNTVTKTSVNTQTTVPTGTFTATPSNTAVNTATFTGTNTPTGTATTASTGTNTVTPSNTPAPANTAVSTPTAAATPDKFEIKDPVVYPNPYNRSQPVYFSFDATQACGSVTLKIYTASFRMILNEELGACLAGRVIKTVPMLRFNRLANGTYYYAITAENYQNKHTISTIQELLLIK